ncbi:MAG: polyprenol monophosphomannose synthase [Microthrixaceae bacterium]
MRTALVVPTYQEAGNIERFLREVRAALPEADVFVFDDNSPDGTGELAERVAEELGRIDVVHRPSKEGLGAAYRHGISHVLGLGYEIVMQMDVDFSHDPAVLPRLRQAILDGADVAVGSRYVPGGATPDWPLRRRMLSKYGNTYSRVMLGLVFNDATAGFRAYRAPVLEQISFHTTRANGYGFMIETGFRLSDAGATVTEVPIIFRDRTVGESKMAIPTMVETMSMVTWWGLCRRAPKLTGRFRTTRLGERLADSSGATPPTTPTEPAPAEPAVEPAVDAVDASMDEIAPTDVAADDVPTRS